MKTNPDAIAAEQAYTVLKKQQEMKKKQQESRVKISAELNDLIESIVKEHQLKGDLLRFKKSVKWIDISTFKKVELQFAVQSKRDTFDDSKRTMAYFYAMAKNMQKQKEQNCREQVARRRYGLDRQAKEERQKVKLALEEKQRQQQLLNAPHLRVIQAAKQEMAVTPLLKKTITIFKKKMDEALLSILRKNRDRKQKFIEKIHHGIMALSEFSLQTRYQMINYINNRLNELSPHSGKVVTPV